MLDFPDYYGWEISRYMLACYCRICQVYYPLDIGKLCPCCHNHLRFRSPKFAITPELRKIYTKRLEEFKKENPQWVLLKQEVLKPIIELKILKGEI